MATIAVDTYLDDGTARTAGEAWTLNDGAQLLIKSDTRWHAGSPASMTGSLGSIAINDGEVFIDGTSVRWLAFNNGANTVPAVGSTLADSSSGSGTVLGVWANLTSAPLAVGAAMPSTGFFKLREVTSAFTDTTDLDTGGPVLGRCVGVDVTGWIEVVCDSAATLTVPRLGKFKTRGDYFYLDDITEVVGQVIQIPTNGGGNGTIVPGVEIETDVGSGVFTTWPALCEMTQTGATYAWSGTHIIVTLASHGHPTGSYVYLSILTGTATSGYYNIVAVPTTGTFVVNHGTGPGTAGTCTIVTAAKNGYCYSHIGAAFGETDSRQNFVKGLVNGQVQIGHALDRACTYANIAAQASTYTVGTHASTYTWVGDVVTVTYITGHSLETGHQVYADFTTGDATGSDGLYTITVLDAYTYTFTLAGSGAGGNVTIRWGLAVSFAAHNLGVGDQVYCDFSTGSGSDGLYTIFGISSPSAYLLAHAPTAGTTGGAVAVHSRYTIQCDTTALYAAGHRVYLDFTSGAGTDGLYTVIYPARGVTQASTYAWATNVVTVTFTSHGRKVGDWVYLYFSSGGATAHGKFQIVTVPTTATYRVALTGSGTSGNVNATHASFDVIASNGAAGDSGNVTVKQTIGNIPPSGCKVRVPNIFLRESATGTRASNMVNATIASRPEFATTAGGDIDLENCLTTWYHNFVSAYKIYLKNMITADVTTVSNIATTTELNNVCTGMTRALALFPLTMTYCLGGTTITNCNFQRGNIPAANGHNVSLSYVIGAVITNSTFGIVQYVRSSGRTLYFTQCEDVVINGGHFLNGYKIFLTAYNANFEINDIDCSDRYIGYTNTHSATYELYIGEGSKNIMIDGMTWGFNAEAINVMASFGIIADISAIGVTLRNIGTFASRIPLTKFRPNYYAAAYIISQTNAESDLRVQRVYLEGVRVAMATTINSASGVTFEHCYVGMYVRTALGLYLLTSANCNSNIKACGAGANTVTANASVYGSHYYDMFLGDYTGRIWLNLNEPTTETASQVSVVTGDAKFTSGGQLGLRGLGDAVIIEDSVFRLGHTGFLNSAPTLTGTNTGNLSYEYDIDTGSGYRGSWNTLNGANLSAETVDPAIGFKIKILLACTTAAITNALTYIRINTTSTPAAQANLYPLEIIDATYTMTGLVAGTEVIVYDDLYTTELDREVIVGTTYTYNYVWNSTDGDFDVNIMLWKDDKQVIKMEGVTLTDENQSVPITQVDDLVYNATITGAYILVFPNKQIEMDSSAETWIVPEVYSYWKNQIRLNDNMQYDFAFRIVGGDEIADPKYIPKYTFLINGWKGLPAGANYTLNVTQGILLVDGGGDPFDDSTGFTVRINYEQPVQAITVATGGSAPITPAEIAAAVWDALTAGYADVGSFGKKVGDLVVAPTAGEVADAVWDEAVIDHSGIGHVGSFGSLAEDIISANVTQLSLDLSDVDDKIDQISLDIAALPAAGDVWEELLASHNNVDTFGEKINSLLPFPALQDIADFVWDTAIPAIPTAGSYGEKVDSLVVAPDAAAISAAVWDEPMGAHLVVGSFGEGFTYMPGDTADEVRTELATELLAINTNLDDKISLVDNNVRTNLATELGLINTNLDAKVGDVEDKVDALNDFDPATEKVTLAAVEHTGAIIPTVKTVTVSLVNL